MKRSVLVRDSNATYREMLREKRAELLSGLGTKFDTLARMGRVAEDDQAQFLNDESVSLHLNTLDYAQLRLIDEARPAGFGRLRHLPFLRRADPAEAVAGGLLGAVLREVPGSGVGAGVERSTVPCAGRGEAIEEQADLGVGRGPGGPPHERLHVRLEHLLHFGLPDGSHALLDYVAALEQQQGRDAPNVVAHGRGAIGIHVQLANLQFSGILAGHDIDSGPHLLARAAPLGPEIHQNRHVGPEDLLVESGVGKG